MKALITACTLLLVLNSFGQKDIKPPELDTKKNTYTLNFSPDSKDDSVQSAYMKGTTEVDSLRFWAAGTITTQKIMVTVITDDKNAKIKVDIVKDHWEDSKINGYTKDGIFQESFDTANKFGIVLTSDTPNIPFYLAVWTGGEQSPDMSGLFFPASEITQKAGMLPTGNSQFNTTGTTKSNTMLYIIIGVLVIIAFLLAFLVFKKKTNKTVLLLFLFGLGYTTVYAGAFPFSANGFANVANGMSFPNDFDVVQFAQQAANLNNAARNYLDAEHDADGEARVNDHGGHRLPSSCLPPRTGTTTSSRNSGYTSGNSSTSGAKGTANDNADTGSGMDVTNQPLASGGQNDASLSDEERQEYERQKGILRREHQERRQKASEDLNEAIKNARDSYQEQMESARGVLNSQLESANGNAQVQASYNSAYVQTTTALTTAHSTRMAQIQGSYDQNSASSQADYQQRLRALADQFSPSKDESSSGDKKRPNGDDDKIGDGDASKGFSGGASSGSGGTNSGGSQGTERTSDNKDGCDCLEEAYKQLNARRLNLEKLRIVYQHGMKKINAGIAFGDNVSGVHAVSGLAWQKQKLIILKTSIPNLNKAYDDKYAEMISGFEENLNMVDQCEKMLGNDNWYNNSGFIYYTFMADKYKRN